MAQLPEMRPFSIASTMGQTLSTRICWLFFNQDCLYSLVLVFYLFWYKKKESLKFIENILVAPPKAALVASSRLFPPETRRWRPVLAVIIEDEREPPYIPENKCLLPAVTKNTTTIKNETKRRVRQLPATRYKKERKSERIKSAFVLGIFKYCFLCKIRKKTHK